MKSPIIYQEKAGIVTITLDRPALRNPISEPEVVDALVDALARLQADRSARVGILTGSGSAFSSGGNVKTMGRAGGLNDSLPMLTRRNYREGIQRIPLAFAALEVPMIAAVNGPAVGAGCDLACMCDIRLASEEAWFAESFVKLGLVAADGGAWLLPRIVGYSKAAEMALTGDRVEAVEALACGLVSAVVTRDALLGTALSLARRIAANPPLTVRLTKRLMVESRETTLSAHLEMAGVMQALAHTTDDHEEAVSAFLERRAPRFSGA